MTQKNEELVRAFYEATIPGHREGVKDLQASHTVHEMPAGICTEGDRLDGADLKHFFDELCAAFDVCFVAEEFITMDERVIATGHIQGVTRSGTGSIDVPFVHVWTVRDARLDQLLFFTDTAMLTQALAQRVGWNTRTEAKEDVTMATDAEEPKSLEQIAFVPVVPASHLPWTPLRTALPRPRREEDDGGLNGLNSLNFRKRGGMT